MPKKRAGATAPPARRHPAQPAAPRRRGRVAMTAGRQDSPLRVVGLLNLRTWLALGPAVLLAFALAYWGFGRIDAAMSGFERIEKAAQLVKGSGTFAFPRDPWQLVVAQWMMPLVAVLTAAKLFLASLRRDLRVAFAMRSRDHVIVCGIGATGRRIVEILRARGERVVAVDIGADDGVRAVESLGAPTIPGDAKTAAVLRLAGVRRARMLVACTGDDTTNLEIALRAVEAGGAGFRFGRRLTVVPEMRSDWLFEHFVSRTGASLGTAAAEVRVLNAAERAGRLLCRAPAFAAAAALRPERTEVAIVGFGDMGRAVAAQTLRTASALPRRRMRLRVFDKRSAAAVAAFTALHPGLDGVADLVAADAEIAAGRPEGWEQVRAGLAGARLAALVVCLPDDGEALYAAARARSGLDAEGERATPVFVRVAGRRKLAELIARTDPQPWLGDRFVPFGDLGELLADGLGADDDDRLARACHEAYLDMLKAPADAPSARPWDELPEMFKRSNRLFADHLEVKLRAAGLRSCAAEAPRPATLTAADMDALAAAEHWRWLIERQLAGWRHGAVRDDAMLRHPLIRPWGELPEEAREGVRTVVGRIPAILARIGRELRRERVAAAGDAAAALDRFDPDGAEHLVLTLDPADPGASALAARAAAVPNVTLRLAPRGSRGGASFNALSPEERERICARIDGCLDAPPAVSPDLPPDVPPAIEAPAAAAS